MRASKRTSQDLLQYNLWPVWTRDVPVGGCVTWSMNYSLEGGLTFTYEQDYLDNLPFLRCYDSLSWNIHPSGVPTSQAAMKFQLDLPAFLCPKKGVTFPFPVCFFQRLARTQTCCLGFLTLPRKFPRFARAPGMPRSDLHAALNSMPILSFSSSSFSRMFLRVIVCLSWDVFILNSAEFVLQAV